MTRPFLFGTNFKMNQTPAESAAFYAQLAATEERLGSCWVAAFDDAQVSESLGAPAHLRPVALMPLGYAARGARAPSSTRTEPAGAI